MPTNKELEAELRALAADHARLVDVVRKLITHVEVLALAAREPSSVPQADLDETLKGLTELHSLVGRLGPEGTAETH